MCIINVFIYKHIIAYLWGFPSSENYLCLSDIFHEHEIVALWPSYAKAIFHFLMMTNSYNLCGTFYNLYVRRKFQKES